MNTGWSEPQEFWSKRRVCVTDGAASFVPLFDRTQDVSIGYYR